MQNIWSPQWRLRSRVFLLQRVKSTPSLSYPNCFSVLPTCSLNETVEPSIDMQNPISKNLIVIPTEIVWNRRPKLERRLTSKLVIASAEDGSTSLKLKVELETTDTGEVKSVNSFMDSGATGEFIDCHYTKSNQLHTRKLSEPIPVYNVDRTLNEAGSITEVVMISSSTCTIILLFHFTNISWTTCHECMFIYFYFLPCIMRMLHASDACLSFFQTHVVHALTMHYTHVLLYIYCS